MIYVIGTIVLLSLLALSFLMGWESAKQEVRKKFELETNPFANIYTLVDSVGSDKIDPDVARKIKENSKLGAIYLEMVNQAMHKDTRPPTWIEIKEMQKVTLEKKKRYNR